MRPHKANMCWGCNFIKSVHWNVAMHARTGCVQPQAMLHVKRQYFLYIYSTHFNDFQRQTNSFWCVCCVISKASLLWHNNYFLERAVDLIIFIFLRKIKLVNVYSAITKPFSFYSFWYNKNSLHQLYDKMICLSEVTISVLLPCSWHKSRLFDLDKN